MENGMFLLFAMMLASYLLGAVPFGLLLGKKFFSIDLRSMGSGNTGATNARRLGGWPLGLATLVLDMAKGALPAGAGLYMFGKSGNTADAALLLVSFAAFIGHLYPVYLGFKTGGKGVATAGGSFLVLSPYALLAALGVFITVTAFSKRVSAGSLLAAAVLPASVYFAESSAVLGLGAAIFSVFIVVRHRENITRLINNNDPRI
jgi:acyl phosphate:glycerol-3-phosphate acyltransferase